MKLRKFIPLLAVALFLFMVIPSAVLAVTITFNHYDFMISTVTNSSWLLSANPASAPPLPAGNTFTLPADMNHSPGGNSYLANNQGKFERYTFTLPTNYSDLSFSFRISVNDWFAAYINGTVVAIQCSTGTENFFEPLPGFFMDKNGTAIDTSSGKLEYLLASGMQALFHAGTNELTVFGRDALADGGLSIAYGEIKYNVTEPPPPGVPEPSVMLLLSCGLVGLWGARRGLKK